MDPEWRRPLAELVPNKISYLTDRCNKRGLNTDVYAKWVGGSYTQGLGPL